MSTGVQELLRLAMASKTSQVRIRLGDLDGQDVGSGRVAPDVAEAVDLGLEGAGKPVIGVARVALVFLNVPILEMRGGERVALLVLQIADVRAHDVERTSRCDGGRAF